MKGILKRCLMAGLFVGAVGVGVAANAVQASAEEGDRLYQCWCLNEGGPAPCCDVCAEECGGPAYICCGPHSEA